MWDLPGRLQQLHLVWTCRCVSIFGWVLGSIWSEFVSYALVSLTLPPLPPMRPPYTGARSLFLNLCCYYWPFPSMKSLSLLYLLLYCYCPPRPLLYALPPSCPPLLRLPRAPPPLWVKFYCYCCPWYYCYLWPP